MRRRLVPLLSLALLILLACIAYYRYTAEGYEDIKVEKDEKTKKAEEDAKAEKAKQDAKDSLNRNKKNLMEYLYFF